MRLLVSAKAAFINFLLEAAKPQSIYLGERRCNILQLGEVKCDSGFDPLPKCFIQRLVNDSHGAGSAGKFWMNLCKSMNLIPSPLTYINQALIK